MKVVFGIGNPGARYQHTYHNLGKLLAEYFVSQSNILQQKEGAYSILYKLNNCYVLISKVYMNESFNALEDFYSFYKISPNNLLVIHDELSLPKYTFKLKLTEGLNAHNGLRDIASQIGKNFAKLNIGIDHPKNFNPHLSCSDYVLSKLDYSAWQNEFHKGIEVINNWLNHI